MLHPHIPEDLKHFGKHLFATFLGLLMALGREQWREHRVEARITREALERVHSELEANKRDLEERLATIRTEQPILEANAQAFHAACQLRREGRKANLPERPKVMTPDLFFTSSAWSTAKSMGVLRHVDSDRIQRMASAYTFMERVQSIMDQMITLPAMQDLLILRKGNPEDCSLSELERLDVAIRFRAARQQMALDAGRQLLADLDRALQR